MRLIVLLKRHIIGHLQQTRHVNAVDEFVKVGPKQLAQHGRQLGHIRQQGAAHPDKGINAFVMGFTNVLGSITASKRPSTLVTLASSAPQISAREDGAFFTASSCAMTSRRVSSNARNEP